MKNIRRIVLLVLSISLLLSSMTVGASQTTAAGVMNKCGYQPLIVEDLGKTEEVIPETVVSEADIYAATKWDSYSSDYYYQYLTAHQKALYDSIYNVCMNYLLTSQNAGTMTASAGETIGCTKPILLPKGMSYNSEDVVEVLRLVMINCPQFYFLNGYSSRGSGANGGYVKLGMYPEWASGSARMRATAQIESKINSWLQEINAQPTVLEKEKKVHDLIVENTIYSYGNYNQSCAGTFLEGQAVCAGYAETFALLCNAIGLETISVVSDNHEWNIINLYGNWYNVDVTWDDHDNGYYYDNYLNVSDSRISEGDHEISDWMNGLNVPKCIWSTVVRKKPVLNGVDYSAVYDEDYYLTKYPDVSRAFGANSDAILSHFVNNGMKEGRQGSANFDVQSYKKQYVDLRNAYGTNLKSYYMHYIKSGKKEGRAGTGCSTLQGSVTKLNGVDYSAVYDYNYYITKYADVKKAYGDDDYKVLQHFVNNGMKEGRQGSSKFSVQSYKNQYADLRRTFGNTLESYYMHYIKSGKKEGRTGTGCSTLQGSVTKLNGVDYSVIYNFNYYKAKYSDIAKAFGNDDVAALKHFVNYGMKEGRQATENFNVSTYKARYSDLQRVFGNNLKAYYQHYMNNGIKEGRSGK